MTDLLAAALVERDLRFAKYPAMIEAGKIDAAEAEESAKAWAAIAFYFGAPCEPQGPIRWHKRDHRGPLQYPDIWFGGTVVWGGRWFEAGANLRSFALADLAEAAAGTLAEREAAVARHPGDQVKAARRDGVARIHALLESRARFLAELNAELRARADRQGAAA